MQYLHLPPMHTHTYVRACSVHKISLMYAWDSRWDSRDIIKVGPLLRLLDVNWDPPVLFEFAKWCRQVTLFLHSVSLLPSFDGAEYWNIGQPCSTVEQPGFCYSAKRKGCNLCRRPFFGGAEQKSKTEAINNEASFVSPWIAVFVTLVLSYRKCCCYCEWKDQIFVAQKEN